MKIGYGASGGSPVSPYAVQEETADAFDAVSATWGIEHEGNGRHKALQSLEVTGRSQLLDGLVFAGLLGLGDGYGVTLTANTNNLAQTNGLAIDDVVIRLQSNSAVNLTGIVPTPSLLTDQTRQVHVLENGGSYTITLKHNATSTAANRFACPNSVDYELQSGAIALAAYDTHSNIWRLLTSGGPVIRSLQQGVVTITAGNSTATATITSVNTAKSYVIFEGAGNVSSTALMPGAAVVLTNATTVTGGRFFSTADEVHVYFTVVEYA